MARDVAAREQEVPEQNDVSTPNQIPWYGAEGNRPNVVLGAGEMRIFDQLEERMGVDTVDRYLALRQLRWLGHVRRLDYAQRLPRRMLSSWV
eukprot:6299138-Prymnesium_polylepis.1